jgi:penicillin-binding protein 2
MYKTRLKIVVVALAVGTVLVLASLLNLQILEGARCLHEANLRMHKTPGVNQTLRGMIYDRNGLILAQDIGASDVAVYYPFIEKAPDSDVEMTDAFVAKMARAWHVSPEEVRQRVAQMWPKLARLTGIPLTAPADRDSLERRKEILRQRVEELRRYMQDRHGRAIQAKEETFGMPTSEPQPIVYDADLKTINVISSHPDDFPGLVKLPARKREYLYANTAPHVLGMLGPISQDELTGDRSFNVPYPPGNLKRYLPGDFVGRGGIEGACEPLLRGTRGLSLKSIDGNLLEDIDAVPGRDIHLTLDIALQADVEEIMDHAAGGKPMVGAAVVIDCRTGEVLTLASAPRYDIGTFRENYDALSEDPAVPLFNRALAGLYPMGSTFKVISAAAGLHEGVIKPSTTFTCEGIFPGRSKFFKCYIYPGSHGPLVLRDAIKKSCDVYFYHIGELLGRDDSGRIDPALGSQRLQDWARRFGLAQPTGIGLPGEPAGRVDEGEPKNLAIGQGKLMVTPLQAAQVYGLAATGGRMPRLSLIRELAPSPEAARRDLHLNKDYMDKILIALDAVVNEPGGTGYGNANLPDIRIFGKSGTAQAGHGGDHAWFIGGATVENPRYIFAVIWEHGGHGGTAAGPVARDIARALRAHGYFEELPADPTAGARPPAIPFTPIRPPATPAVPVPGAPPQKTVEAVG